jgi:hypothetical protein
MENLVASPDVIALRRSDPDRILCADAGAAVAPAISSAVSALMH